MSRDKEKQETYRLIKDPAKYNEEIEAKVLVDDKDGYTDYQANVALDWLKKRSGIKK